MQLGRFEDGFTGGSEVLDHHPDMRIVYSTVNIVLSTHDAGGVTEKDFELAKKIEQYS